MLDRSTKVPDQSSEVLISLYKVSGRSRRELARVKKIGALLAQNLSLAWLGLESIFVISKLGLAQARKEVKFLSLTRHGFAKARKKRRIFKLNTVGPVWIYYAQFQHMLTNMINDVPC